MEAQQPKGCDRIAAVDFVFRGDLSMKRWFWAIIALAAAVRLIDLQRKLEAARSRGDMYRDISSRLDRQLADLQKQA